MFKSWPLVIVGLTALLLTATARADGGVEDLMKQAEEASSPAQDLSSTANWGKPMRLTSNKDVLLRLNEDAATVVVNNPDHVQVMLDSPRLLIIMPRNPGTTSFTVLNADSRIILQKDVIVSNVQQQYVRIRKMCTGGDSSCAPSSYYYCPDGCYEVTPVQPGTGSTAVPPAQATASAAARTAAGMGGSAEHAIQNPVQPGNPAAAPPAGLVAP